MRGGAVTSVAEVYAALRTLNPSWYVEVGRPSGPGWIAGADFRDATDGPFHDFLLRLGERQKTADRRTIAASFALRFGWASAMAIGPYLKFACVPDIALDNVSFKFRASTFFERTAMHEPRGTFGDPHVLLRVLRDALVEQSRPVVNALFEWSGFARRATWGILTSSWASQFTNLGEDRRDHRAIRPILDRFFEGDDEVFAMRPVMHAVELEGAVHLYQRRASCCRYYLVPEGHLCASCPLVTHEERLRRNREWMQAVLARDGRYIGHD
ncbi:MAG TPA: (2Fe-2S)-binding protein [Gemmatimonadaceae bacterium]|nr:(2Fe-2S)-binding protein [Gemmatimonadaceae bacterium]